MESINIIRGKALYTTNGAAYEYAPVGCNFYVGCSNLCRYCYLKKGILKKAMGNNIPQLKKCFKSVNDAFDVFCKEAAGNLDTLKKTGVFFSFSTDPLLPECQKLTWLSAEISTISDIPVKILTKSTDFFRDYGPYLKNLSNKQKDIISFGFTLTGRDDWEPNAPSNQERIETMKMVNSWGYNTFASIEPIIDFNSSYKMIEQSKDFCSWYGIGLMTKNGMTYNPSNAILFYKAVEKLIPDTKIYWKNSFKSLLRASNFTLDDEDARQHT